MKQKGFTIIELIVVIGILGVVLSVSLPSLVGIKANQDAMEISAHEEQINKYIRQYYVLHGVKISTVDMDDSAVRTKLAGQLVSITSDYTYSYDASDGLFGSLSAVKN